jgi:hypothetical protein
MEYVVCITSWAGLSYCPVEVLERQPRRVTVRFLQDTVGHREGSLGYPPYKAVGSWVEGQWVPLPCEER